MNVYVVAIVFLSFLYNGSGQWTQATKKMRHNHFYSGSCDKQNITIDGLQGLKVDCSNRGLSRVPTNLPNLTLSLDLSNNNLKSVSHDDFEKLGFLFELFLFNNQITEIDKDAFKILVNLCTLDISGNKLPMNTSFYQPDVFRFLYNVTVLKLNRNIETTDFSFRYPSSALGYLSQLKQLFIDGLTNQTFGKEMSKLENLIILTFNGHTGFCQLEYITEDFFVNLPYLKQVDLLKCQITGIHRQAFMFLQDIVNLDVSDNNYLGFDQLAVAFEELQNSTSLRQLRINNVYYKYHLSVKVKCSLLKSLTKTSLEHLEMDYNQIESMEFDNFTNCFPQSIKYLSMRRNRFIYNMYLYEILTMPNLETIDLSDQSISHSNLELQFMAFGKKLRTIVYNSNGVKKFIGPFPGIKYVERLELENNACFRVTQNFFDSGTSLIYLNLKKNILSFDLEADVGGKIFKNLHKLQTLVLDRNRITKLPAGVLQSLGELQNLDLANNRLTTWNVILSHMDNLTTVNLENNTITSLDVDAMRELGERGSQMSLNLLGNPLVCSCQTLKFIKWLQSTPVTITNLSDYKCLCENGPEKTCHLSNIDSIIKKLESECFSYVPYIIGSAAFLVVVLIIVFGLVVRKYKWRLTYLYYIVNAKYGGYQQLDEEFKRDAYISYADEDVEFVIHRIVDELEEKRGLKVCFRHREFIPGVAIAENITNWIHKCSHTIVVLSEDYVKHKWCNFEFNIASMDNIYTNRDVIILVIYKNVSKDKLSPEIREFKVLNKDSVLTYADDGAFWDALSGAANA